MSSSKKKAPKTGGISVSSLQKKVFTPDEQASYVHKLLKEPMKNKKTVQKLSKQL
jgi:hypothetical protein